MNQTQQIRMRVTIDDPLVRSRMIWLWDNKPEYLLELSHQPDQALEMALLRVVLQARTLNRYLELNNPELKDYEIEEMVLNIVCPSEGLELRETENPISYRQFQNMEESLEDCELVTPEYYQQNHIIQKDNVNETNPEIKREIINLKNLKNPPEKMSYFLRVFDNFHDMDEDDFDDIGSFSSEQEALIEAQRMVKNSVIHLWSTSAKIEELVNSWLSFGNDPKIRCTNLIINAPFFSSRNYAEEVVEKLKESLKDDRANIQSIYQETILFAAEKHARINQMIPGTSIPYAVHLSNLCMEIFLADQKTDNFNLKLAIQAALLHDTLEDTDTTEIELEEKFGIAIPACIKALTKNPELPKDQRMADSLNRIKKMPFEIWAVKLADRITNLQPPPAHWNNERKIAYREEAKVILNELSKGNEFLAKRLETKIEEYQNYITN